MNESNMQNGNYDIFGDCFGLCNVLQPRERGFLEALLKKNEHENFNNMQSYPPSPIVSSSSHLPDGYSYSIDNYDSSPNSVSTVGLDSLNEDINLMQQNQVNFSTNHLKPFTRSDMQRLFGREFTEDQRSNPNGRCIPPADLSNYSLPNHSPQMLPIPHFSPGMFANSPNPQVPSSYNNNTPADRGYENEQSTVKETPSPTYSGVVALGGKPSIQRTSGCSFCRNNKEVEDWYLSHQLKDGQGRVVCPVLRSYVCPLCCASGDNAHTVGHCPKNPDRKSSIPLAVRTRTNAIGKRVMQGKFN